MKGAFCRLNHFRVLHANKDEIKPFTHAASGWQRRPISALAGHMPSFLLHTHASCLCSAYTGPKFGRYSPYEPTWSRSISTRKRKGSGNDIPQNKQHQRPESLVPSVQDSRYRDAPEQGQVFRSSPPRWLLPKPCRPTGSAVQNSSTLFGQLA